MFFLPLHQSQLKAHMINVNLYIFQEVYVLVYDVTNKYQAPESITLDQGTVQQDIPVFGMRCLPHSCYHNLTSIRLDDYYSQCRPGATPSDSVALYGQCKKYKRLQYHKANLVSRRWNWLHRKYEMCNRF